MPLVVHFISHGLGVPDALIPDEVHESSQQQCSGKDERENGRPTFMLSLEEMPATCSTAVIVAPSPTAWQPPC